MLTRRTFSKLALSLIPAAWLAGKVKAEVPKPVHPMLLCNGNARPIVFEVGDLPQTVHWSGRGNPNIYNDPANWHGGKAPSPGDVCVFGVRAMDRNPIGAINISTKDVPIRPYPPRYWRKESAQNSRRSAKCACKRANDPTECVSEVPHAPKHNHNVCCLAFAPPGDFAITRG